MTATSSSLHRVLIRGKWYVPYSPTGQDDAVLPEYTELLSPEVYEGKTYVDEIALNRLARRARTGLPLPPASVGTTRHIPRMLFFVLGVLGGLLVATGVLVGVAFYTDKYAHSSFTHYITSSRVYEQSPAGVGFFPTDFFSFVQDLFR